MQHRMSITCSGGLALHTLAAPDEGRGNAFPDSEEGNAPCLEEEEESANAEGHKERVVETDAIASSLSVPNCHKSTY